MPLSFVVGVTDIEILQNSFLASPCVTEAGSPHKVILVRGGRNVTPKLSRGLEQAEQDWDLSSIRMSGCHELGICS